MLVCFYLFALLLVTSGDAGLDGQPGVTGPPGVCTAGWPGVKGVQGQKGMPGVAGKIFCKLSCLNIIMIL